MPVLLKGPTGCGKTRFVEYMAWRSAATLASTRRRRGPRLVTVACHEDLTASDLVGRYLLEGDETRWIDGPLTRAVKAGAICYLDEVVEARKDTTVLIHPLTDHRRILPIEKTRPGRSRRSGLPARHLLQPRLPERAQGPEAQHPPALHRHRVRLPAARRARRRSSPTRAASTRSSPSELAKLGEKVRNLREHGLAEGVSTRLLVYAAQLIDGGIPPRRACHVAIAARLTDDVEVQRAVAEIVDVLLAVTERPPTVRVVHDVQRVLGLFADGIAGRPMHASRSPTTSSAGWPWAAGRCPTAETVRVAAPPTDRRRLPGRRPPPDRLRRVRHARARRGAHETPFASAATRASCGGCSRSSRTCASTPPPAAATRVPAATSTSCSGAHARPPGDAPVERRDALVDACSCTRSARPATSCCAGVPPCPHRAPRRDRSTSPDPLRAADASARGRRSEIGRAGRRGARRSRPTPHVRRRRARRRRPGRPTEPPGRRPHGGDVPRPPSARHGAGATTDRTGSGRSSSCWRPIPGAAARRRTRRRRRGGRPTRLPAADDVRDTRFCYDEWNYHGRRYLPAWCRVLEQRLHGDDRVVHRRRPPAPRACWPAGCADSSRSSARRAGCASTTPTTATSSTSTP